MIAAAAAAPHAALIAAAARHPALTAAAIVVVILALLIAVTLNQVSCSPQHSALIYLCFTPTSSPLYGHDSPGCLTTIFQTLFLLVAHQVLNCFICLHIHQVFDLCVYFPHFL